MIERIGKAASKELTIVQALDKMQADLTNKILQNTPYKNSGILNMYLYSNFSQTLWKASRRGLTKK